MRPVFLRHCLAACLYAALGVTLGAPLAAVAASAGWKAYSEPAGQEPAPVQLPDMAGRQVNLADFKGEVVLVNFWATWCEPCRQEMPSLNRLQQQLAGRKLRVIGINIGEGRPRIEEFLDKVPVGFPILRDTDMEVMRSWRVRVLPASFLLDARGALRYQLTGDADWDEPGIRAPILQLMKESRPWSSSSSALQHTVKPSARN